MRTVETYIKQECKGILADWRSYQYDCNQACATALSNVFSSINLPAPELTSQDPYELIETLHTWVAKIQTEANRIDNAIKQVLDSHGLAQVRISHKNGHGYNENPINVYVASHAIKGLIKQLKLIAKYKAYRELAEACLTDEQLKAFTMNRLADAIENMDVEFPSSIGLKADTAGYPIAISIDEPVTIKSIE